MLFRDDPRRTALMQRFELIHEERVGRMARPELVQRGLERKRLRGNLAQLRGSGAT
jgi:hypothetical protein